MDRKKITEYIRKYQMIRPGDSVIAAVSGGADSVAMLLLLSELSEEMEFGLFAVHVQHGIRGEESLADMRFTRNLCEKQNIPLCICHVDAPAYAAQKGIGLEEAARLLRYQALDDAARHLHCNMVDDAVGELAAAEEFYLSAAGGARYSADKIKIALAHHIQDQAETVLFRLARGSGLSGLAGMQPVRRSERGYTYIRPLLGVLRSEIEEYLAERGQNYCTDSTNLDESYARNRIRARVLPELSVVNQQAAVHIAQAAEMAAETGDYIEGEARRELERIAKTEPGEGILSIDIPELSKLHPALQKELLRQALVRISGRRKDLTSEHVAQLLELKEKTSGKELSLPCQVRAKREFDRLVLVKISVDDLRESEQLKPTTMEDRRALSNTAVEQIGGLVEIGPELLMELKETGKTLEVSLGDSEAVILKVCAASSATSADGIFPQQEYFDWKKLKDGFAIRHRQPGDYFLMKDGHRKKLKQFLIEEKIPASARPKLWLLACGEWVVWLPGKRTDSSFLVNEHTKYAISLEFYNRRY